MFKDVALASENLLWRSWDEDCVIFNDLNGAIHVISDLERVIFEELLTHSHVLMSKLVEVVRENTYGETGDCVRIAEQIVTAFSSLGLLRN
jgi:hypothetical protein